MTKRNISLASALLLILVIIIGIILSIASPRALGLGGLGLRKAGLTSATSRGGLNVPGRHALAVDSQDVNVHQVGTLNAHAGKLSGASLNLLNG